MKKKKKRQAVIQPKDPTTSIAPKRPSACQPAPVPMTSPADPANRSATHRKKNPEKGEKAKTRRRTKRASGLSSACSGLLFSPKHVLRGRPSPLRASSAGDETQRNQPPPALLPLIPETRTDETARSASLRPSFDFFFFSLAVGRRDYPVLVYIKS